MSKPDDLSIERTTELELDADELWALISTAEGWSSWLVDDAQLVVETDAEGTATEDGVVRGVRIDSVVDGRGINFSWWDHDDPADRVARPTTDRRVAGRQVAAPHRRAVRRSRNGDDVHSLCVCRGHGVVGCQDGVAVAVGIALHRDGVSRTAPQTDLEPDGGALDALFGALSDPTRRMLVERLLKRGPSTATVLAETTPLTRQAVLKHLQVLEAADLLDHERVGREVRYRVTPQPLASAVGWILDTAGLWDKRIDRLRRLPT